MRASANRAATYSSPSPSTRSRGTTAAGLPDPAVVVRLRSAEIVPLVQVLDKPWLDRPPPEQLARQCARGRLVYRENLAQEAETLGRHGRDRQVEVTPDHLGDVADRHALVADGVQPRARWSLLHCQAEQVRGVQHVHRGPATGPVADIA